MPTSPVFKSNQQKKPKLLSSVSVKPQPKPATIAPAKPAISETARQNQLAFDQRMGTRPTPTPPPATPSPMSPANVTAAMSAPKTDALGQDMTKLATLVNPKTGQKQVVRSNSPVAKQFFGQGYVLEGSEQEKQAKAEIEKQNAQQQLATSIKAPSSTAEVLQQDTRTQPASVNPTPDAITQLRQAILQNLTQSDSERVTAEQLGELISSSNEAIAGVAGQGRGITADLVTGQQGAIRNVAAAEAQTLEQRLARKEAERRANLQQAQTLLGFEQADKEAQTAEQQANQQKLESLALQAAQAGATPEEIQGILASTDFGQALTGASQFLKAPSELLSVEEAQKLGLPYGTTQAEAASMGITPQEEQNLLNGMSEDQISIMQNIQNQVRQDPDIKGFIDVRDSYNRLVASAEDPSAAGDLALIFNYMKILDPGSTVREGEFANAQNAAGIPEQIRAKYNQITQGERLTDETRADFVDRASRLYQPKLASYQDAIDFYSNQTQAFGIPTGLVLRDFAGTSAGGGAGSVQPLTKSYPSLDALFQERPEYVDIVSQIATETGMTDQEILQLLSQQGSGGGGSGLFTNDLTLSQNGSSELGSLSEKYESGSDPGAIGYDSTGGWSYGAYQLAHNNAKRFVESSKYAQDFAGIPFNSQEFQNKWKEIAQRDPEGFKREQKAYIGQTHYQPQLDKIQRETGLNINRLSPAMQDVIWSTAVQHGANTDIIVNALKQAGRNATEEQVINLIYDLRWSGGQQFRSSTQQVKNAVKNRFDSERQLALSKLRNTA